MTFKEDFEILKNLYKNREEERFKKHFSQMMSVYGEDSEVQETLLSWVNENLGEMEKDLKEVKKDLEEISYQKLLSEIDIL